MITRLLRSSASTLAASRRSVVFPTGASEQQDGFPLFDHVAQDIHGPRNIARPTR